MKCITDARNLTIEMEGFEKVWALKGRLVIPREGVSEVNFTPEIPVVQDFKGALRAPGTALPWRFLAGTYRRHGEREFWYVHLNQPGLLTIELKEGTLGYDRVRINCTPENAQTISDWWRQKSAG